MIRSRLRCDSHIITIKARGEHLYCFMLLQEVAVYNNVLLRGFPIKRNKKGAPLGTPFFKILFTDTKLLNNSSVTKYIFLD